MKRLIPGSMPEDALWSYSGYSPIVTLPVGKLTDANAIIIKINAPMAKVDAALDRPKVL